MEYDFDETEDVDTMELMVGENTVAQAGIARESGTVYLPGDIHPLGSFAALMRAANQLVPYISTSAVNAMYPSDWLKAECLHDIDRLRIIANMELLVRGTI